MGGNQGRIEEAHKELDEEGEGHIKFICEGKKGGGNVEERHYYRRFKEEGGSGNILLFQTYCTLNMPETHHQIESLGEDKCREEHFLFKLYVLFQYTRLTSFYIVIR